MTWRLNHNIIASQYCVSFCCETSLQNFLKLQSDSNITLEFRTMTLMLTLSCQYAEMIQYHGNK